MTEEKSKPFLPAARSKEEIARAVVKMGDMHNTVFECIVVFLNFNFGANRCRFNLSPVPLSLRSIGARLDGCGFIVGTTGDKVFHSMYSIIN